jgi:hypothetical protein
MGSILKICEYQACWLTVQQIAAIVLAETFSTERATLASH